MLSFLRYAFTQLGCHPRQTGLENLYTSYLCSGHMQVNTLDHVYSRCILHWHSLRNSYTLSSLEGSLVRLVGQSSEGVLGLSSPSIHTLLMTCLYFRLSIASLAGTLLDYDARLLLTSEEHSKALFKNYWSPVSHSTVCSACRLVSPQVFLRSRIPAHFLLLPRCHRLWKRS